MTAIKKLPPPFVSVVVLTYMRQDDLIRTLCTVARQRYPHLEIIVVNNHQDDTAEVVHRRFPEIKVLTFDENIGCAARNKGVEAAIGDIVITIDNDVHLKGDDFIDRVVDFFERHSDVVCVNFRVLDPGGDLSTRDWCHPRVAGKWANESFPTDHISEGACAFRKFAFLAVNGYSQDLFIGHEGPELQLRLLKRGYHTWYYPEIEVYHYASMAARPSWRAHYYNTRNNLLYAYWHLPFGLLMRHFAWYGCMSFCYALKDWHLGAFCRGLWDALKMSRMQPRQPLNREQHDCLKQLWKEKPSALAKIRKHLRMRQSYR